MDSNVKYGQEIGPNLIKMAKRLCKNESLVMLLQNTDLEPLNKTVHPEKVDGLSVWNTLIRTTPLLTAEEQSTKSKLVLLFDTGTISSQNSDNENLSFVVEVLCPFKEWNIAGDNLRPFAIMAEVRKSLQGKRINGLGEIAYEGFTLSTLTEEMGSYTMRFRINAFS